MPGDHRAARDPRPRRLPAVATGHQGGHAGGRRVPGLGRDRGRRARVDVRPRLPVRPEHPVPGADRRGAVLPRHSGVRIADLQRRDHPPGKGAAPMTGLGYTVPAALAVLLVCALELGVLRTGLFRRPAYWLSMLIVLGFQIPVDGWLTNLSSPIVIYDDKQLRGLRFPYDIPVEDFLFGFALVTAVLLLWERQRARR